ncbi:MAG: class I tRNA ligase family protein, partial [Verrucomicrobia bacterium]|nr:class I tRNA ligase family protein [Verrucomicrobiota bacterium]
PASAVCRPSSVVYPPSSVVRHAVDTIILLLAPLAPHIAEELWVELGHAPGVLQAAWPVADPAALARDRVEIALQLNGKFRGTMMAPAGSDRKSLEDMALAQSQIAKVVKREQVVKMVVVPDKLVNIVFKP